MMKNNKILLDTLNTYEAPTTTTSILEDNPIVWKEAKGAVVTDVEGGTYIDLSSGSGVANIGHSHPRVVQAITENVSKLMHTGWTYPSESRIQLLEKIKDKLPSNLQKFIFSVTGSEGVETALKLARFHTKKSQFIAFHGAFHGKTAGSLGVTSRGSFKQDVIPSVSVVSYFHYPNCYRCPFQMSHKNCNMFCLEHMEYTLSLPSGGLENIAGIIVEPIQGAEGMVVPPKGFYKRLRELADRLGILLIFDEIFTGMGRTGEFFAFEHEDIIPDILILGKALGGGIPITMVAARPEIMENFPAFKQTSTFSASPLAASAAIATLDVIDEEKLLSKSKHMGEYLLNKLRQLQKETHLIGDVRGLGMMIGIELVLDKTKKPAKNEAKKFTKRARDYGLILLSGGSLGNVLKVTPPLILTQEQADYIIDSFRKILTEIEEGLKTYENNFVG
ncbi:aspartate aminotransferase family protein [Bacillus cereus]|nr:aspartate aminotransferase family protein [Bacillus cereus group sp. BfR-BA-01347]MBJ8204391.1 aspartate aminotransferase family protein [Bacillus cereus]TBX40074.1 aspartate aminotransferase family protein [Bacillus thuringiensis]